MDLRLIVPGGEFLQGDPAFGFEADIDQGGVVLDRDDTPLDDGAFKAVGATHRFIEQGREILFRAEFGGFGCYGHSLSSIPDCGKASRRDRSGRAAGRKSGAAALTGPAKRDRHRG